MFANFQNIKAIVFDLDDTLYLQADYKLSGFKAVAKWLQVNMAIDFSISLKFLKNIMEEYGPSYPYMFNRLCEQLQIEQQYTRFLVQAFLDHDPDIHCFEKAIPLLRKLRRHYKLGLLTDGRVDVQRKKVETLGIENLFTITLYSDSLGLEKPSPSLYEYFENQWSFRPNQFCYVGDNPKKDFIEAKRRDWLTIRVKTGEYSSYECCSSHSAMINIDSVVNIKSLISFPN